jgi:hypothetical protein
LQIDLLIHTNKKKKSMICYLRLKDVDCFWQKLVISLFDIWENY